MPAFVTGQRRAPSARDRSRAEPRAGRLRPSMASTARTHPLMRRDLGRHYDGRAAEAFFVPGKPPGPLLALTTADRNGRVSPRRYRGWSECRCCRSRRAGGSRGVCVVELDWRHERPPGSPASRRRQGQWRSRRQATAAAYFGARRCVSPVPAPTTRASAGRQTSGKATSSMGTACVHFGHRWGRLPRVRQTDCHRV